MTERGTEPSKQGDRKPMDLHLPDGSLGALIGFAAVWAIFFATGGGGIMAWLAAAAFAVVFGLAAWAMARSSWLRTMRLVKRLRTLDRLARDGVVPEAVVEDKRQRILAQI